MTPDPFAYDPEKALWKPNRRGFLSLFGCAVAAAFVPSLPDSAPFIQPAIGWSDSILKVGDTFTIGGVYQINPPSWAPKALQDFKVTAIHGGVLTISPSIMAPAGKWGKING